MQKVFPTRLSVTAPKRIQLRRTKGWILPPNTVCVTRPGKWGNPYIVVRNGSEWQVLHDGEVIAFSEANVEAIREHALIQFQGDLSEGKLPFTVSDVRRELNRKNLACWCPIGSPCHADVLLEIANSDEGGSQ